MKRIPLSLSVAVALTACGEPPPNFHASERAPAAELSVLTTSAAPGGGIELVLSNPDDVGGGYNLCPLGAQVWRDGSWGTLTDGPLFPTRDEAGTPLTCTYELRILAPGQQVIATHALSPTAPPGIYRVTTQIRALEGQGEQPVFSNSFVVE